MRPGEYVVQLPGERKLRTPVSLLLGDHSLSVSAFVIRNPDENHAGVHRWLLERNPRPPGRWRSRSTGPATCTCAACSCLSRRSRRDTLDALLGEVLEVSDGSFNELLALGFLAAMRKEWAWRVSRGESTRNLEAFSHLLQD